MEWGLWVSSLKKLCLLVFCDSISILENFMTNTDSSPIYNRIMLIFKILFVWMVLWFCLIRPFLMWEGRDFPKETEILYAEGKLLASTMPSASRSGSRVGAMEICETAKECHSYHCGYSAYYLPSLQSCFGNYENLKPHHRKQAKVGYYYQKDFLWFHNPHRQMVSLEIEKQSIKNYQDTEKSIKIGKKTSLIFYGLMLIFLTAFYYVLFIYVPKKNALILSKETE